MQSTLEIRHFQLLRAIADEGSVTAAARGLHLSQPALSRALGDLEDKLGLTLFHRGARNMRPTPVCLRLLQTADKVLSLVTSEEERLRKVVSGIEASIRVTTECYTCYRWLPKIIEQFRRESEGIVVEIDTDNTSRPIEALREGSLDLAIVYTMPDDSQLSSVSLFEDELMVVVPPDHRLASKSTIRAEDFANEHLIVYSTKGSDVMNQLLIPSGVRPGRISAVQITDGILDLVKAGLGISVVASWAAAADIREGRLTAIPIEGHMFVRQWQAAAMNETLSLPHVARFVELLVENQRLFCA